jgi:excisionase family DNA binding protein
MTSAELAEMLRAPEQTLRYWRWKGTGPKGIKVGRRVLYRRSDVDAWLAAREATEHGAA